MTDATPPLAWTIYGCRTTYLVLAAEIIWRRGDAIDVLVDNLAGPVASELGRVVAPEELTGNPGTRCVYVPLTTPGHRYTAAAEARARGLIRFPPLVDPTSTTGLTDEIGEGASVSPHVLLGGRVTLAPFAMAMSGSILSHHVSVGAYATIGPGCTLAGHVTVQTGAFLGAGAVCAPNVTIGSNAVVGTGAVVIRDVPDFAVVVGNPARVLRIAEHGHGGATVPVG